MWTRRRIVIAAVAVVAVAGLVAGLLLAFNHGQPAQVASSPVAQLRSPFTGEPVNKLDRVLAVKIDNIVNARPQTGLTHADIVYVLPVEGGLTRYMAIFSSDFPAVVGPVRSAREDDIELLRQFGRPAFAYSGHVHHLVRPADDLRHRPGLGAAGLLTGLALIDGALVAL